MLRNFGVFIIAETIEEAFYLTYNVMSAIDAQVGRGSDLLGVQSVWHFRVLLRDIAAV